MGAVEAARVRVGADLRALGVSLGEALAECGRAKQALRDIRISGPRGDSQRRYRGPLPWTITPFVEFSIDAATGEYGSEFFGEGKGAHG